MCASISYETTTINKTGFRKSTLNIPIKFFVTMCISPSSTKVSFTTGTSHWTTGLLVKFVALCKNIPGICLTCCFYIYLVIAMFDTAFYVLW